MNSTTSFKGDKLVGRSNIIEWLTNARLFLEINGFIPYIDESELRPNKSLYYSDSEPKSPELAVRFYERETDFNKNNKRALGALKSIISIENTERFKDKNSAKDLWEAILYTFGESSLELIGRHLDRIVNANYSAFKSMDEYTSQIQSSAIYLKETKNEMPKAFIAWHIFKGLPNAFDSFISRKYEELAKDLIGIDISKLISDLIAEEARMRSNIDQEANRASNSSSNKNSYKNKGNIPHCNYCKLKGHLEAKCYKKYPELKSNY